MEKDISAALVTRLQNEDTNALGELYELIGKKIYNRCLFILKDSDLANDALHDVFLKVFGRIKSIKDNTKLEAWTNTICYNHCMDFFRDKLKEKESNLSSEIHEYSENLILTIEAYKHSEDLNANLKSALNDLKEIDRLILVMHYWEGQSISEIADALDLGESAVKMKLSRSREKLKTNLKNNGHTQLLELLIFAILNLV